jgi:hypothetical protein
MTLFRWMKASLAGSGLLCAFAGYGQGVPDSYGQRAPLGALPLQYNSSFAGEAGGPRLSTSFGFQPRSASWPNRVLDNNISYDQFISAISTGIGITAGWLSERIETGYNATNYSGSYHYQSDDYYFSVAVAPKFSIKGKYTLSPSIDFNYRPNTNSFGYSPSNLPYTDKDFQEGHRVQSRIGLLFNTNKFYAGYAVYVLNRYQYSIRTNDTSYASTSRGHFLSFLQAGYAFQRSATSKFSFTPQLVLRIAEDNHNNALYVRFEAINFNFKYQQFIWGVNNQGAHIGWQTNQFRAMFSSNFTRAYYLGNLSIRYIFKNSTNNRIN